MFCSVVTADYFNFIIVMTLRTIAVIYWMKIILIVYFEVIHKLLILRPISSIPWSVYSFHFFWFVLKRGYIFQ